MSVNEFRLDPRSGDVTVERSNGQVDSFSLADAVTRNSSGQLVGPDGQVVGGDFGPIDTGDRIPLLPERVAYS